MRPDLDNGLSPDTFKVHRWLKAELLDFCREHDLPTDGSKHHIKRRVAGYLAAQRRIMRSSQADS